MEDEKALVTLATPMEELEQKIIEEKDINELNNIIDIFNLNMKRKDLVRANKLNNLQDNIVQEMEKRITDHSDEFNNEDLLKYFKTVQETITKSDNTLDNIKTPTIQVNQINIEEPKLNRESRQRVLDAVNAILKGKQNQNETQTEEAVDVEFEVMEDNNSGPTDSEN